jgi:hypothetical protein
MPGFLVHLGADVLCAHWGIAKPIVTNPRVLVGGQPTVTIASAYRVSGCTLSPNSGGPCVSAKFTSAATRITSGGQPLLLSDSAATCAPTLAPLAVLITQTRASGK